MNQSTLSQSLVYVGRDSASQELVTVSIHPALADSGIHFVRLDKGGHSRMVHASWDKAECANNSLNLVNAQKVRVEKVEFILAALKLARVDNAVVELYSEQVGVGYGNVGGLYRQIKSFGIKNQAGFSEKKKLNSCLAVERDNRYAIISPADRTQLSLDIENVSDENSRWCLATLDIGNVDSECVAPEQGAALGITINGGKLPYPVVNYEMLSALGLMTLFSDYEDVHLQGIRFNLDLGLELLKWLHQEREENIEEVRLAAN